MTVRFVKFWNGRFPGQVDTLDADTERRLKASGIAASVHALGASTIYGPPTPTAEQEAFAEARLDEIEAYKATLPD